MADVKAHAGQEPLQSKPEEAKAQPRRSKRQFNYDEDYQESSVFVEPFKLQERQSIDPDRSLIYRDQRSRSRSQTRQINGEQHGKKDEQEGQVVVDAQGQHQKGVGSRFSVSFAQEEADSTRTVAVEELADNSELQRQMQALRAANADFDAGSLINRIEGS